MQATARHEQRWTAGATGVKRCGVDVAVMEW